ncbi:MAG TPA: TolC family protein [Lunatimonas sp.]|nr:TolC family protein [Lunatimonas sp.]
MNCLCIRNLIVFIFTLGFISPGHSQEVLSYGEFLTWVQMNHPVAKQGELILELGQQEIRMARGGFDPFLFANQDEKTFNNTDYYQKREGGVLIPTMAGVEFKGLMEQNSGTYLNSENTVPPSGLVTVGASVNLGQGLFIDKRRAALRKAQIYLESTAQERNLILNDLYLSATTAYWDWAKSYADLEIYQEGLELAEFRFEGIKTSFFQGDLPAIDTVEAYTQVLNRTIRLQDAENSFFAKTQEVNVFLWDESENPMFLQTNIVPENLDNEPVAGLEIDVFRGQLSSHPEIQLLDYDIDYLEVERRWRAEQLKPVVKFNYNFLSETISGMEPSPFFENNYKFGVTISTPLFLRRERGALGITKANINITGYKRDLTYQKIIADLEKQYNNFLVLNKQVSTFENNIGALERLLEGERIKFDMGESSLFLINAREVGLFDALVVLNSIYAERNISIARARTAAGLGFELAD